MKISTTGKEVTIIEFSRAELESCRITYENISRNVAESKTAIYKIISETAKIAGNSKVIDENTLIDILPDGEGGCVIVLNNISAHKPSAHRAVYFDTNFDSFFDLARALPKDKVTESTLYEYEGVYFLAVDAEQSALKLCSEFLSFYCDDHAGEVRLREYGKPLIENDVLKVLGGTASEK